MREVNHSNPFIPSLHLANASPPSVIPISANQDTVGPITRSLTDAAIVLSVIAGKDPNDNFTLAQPDTVPDFTKALDVRAIKGKRIGVPRLNLVSRANPTILAAFETALDTLRGLGAIIVDPADLPSINEIRASGNESLVLNTDFKVCFHT